jgi:hypothetical protein
LQQPVQYAIEVVIAIDVPSPEHQISLSFQVFRSPLVSHDFVLIAVRDTVELNDQLFLPAEKIHNIGANFNLAIETKA